jgi:hypothetical protein
MLSAKHAVDVYQARLSGNMQRVVLRALIILGVKTLMRKEAISVMLIVVKLGKIQA